MRKIWYGFLDGKGILYIFVLIWMFLGVRYYGNSITALKLGIGDTAQVKNGNFKM